MSNTRIGLLALSSVAMAGAGAWALSASLGSAGAQPRVQQRGQSPVAQLQPSKADPSEIALVRRGQQEVLRLSGHTPPKALTQYEKAALAGVSVGALQSPAVLSPQKPYLNEATYLSVSPQHSAVSFDARENAIGVGSAAGVTTGQVVVSFRSAPGTKYVVECQIDTSKAKTKTALLYALIFPYGPKVTASSKAGRVAMVVQNTSTKPQPESVHFWAANDFWILTRCEITPAKV